VRSLGGSKARLALRRIRAGAACWMTGFVRRCCAALTHRNHDEPLLFGAGPPDSPAERSLRRLACVRRECEALVPVLTEALCAAAPSEGSSGELALMSVRARLDDLEDLLMRLSAASSMRHNESAPVLGRGEQCKRWLLRKPQAICEASPCLAAHGKETVWKPGRVVLSDSGFCFESTLGSDQPAGLLRITPWSDVVMVDTHEPCRSFGQAEASLLFEITLRLRIHPGQLRLQFGSVHPARLLTSLWRPHAQLHVDSGEQSWSSGSGANESASTEAVPQRPKGWDQMHGILRESAGRASCATTSVYQTSLELQAASRDALASKLRAIITSRDEESPITRLWRSQNVHSWLQEEPWVPLHEEPQASGLLVRSLYLWLPLKPQPLAPKRTRIFMIYCLSGNPEGDELVLTALSTSLDVPYSSSFMVQVEHIFSLHDSVTSDDSIEDCELPGGQYRLEVDIRFGVLWSSSCMVKGIIEAASRQETVACSKELVTFMAESLASGCD